jgi:ribosomal protein S18 acetylase RimI-like enzyme
MISTSSAYPPGEDGVILAARVHANLPSLKSIDPEKDIRYSSSVSSAELDEIRLLHTEWFPVAYHEDFFESIVSGTGFGGGDVVTVVATIGTYSRQIVGLITIAVKRNEKQYNPTADLCPALKIEGNSTTAYILTLGVIDELRGKGVGRKLLDAGIRKISETDSFCRVIFLHVIEYNEAAKKFYLREKFIEFKKYSEFYFFDGKVFDGVLFYKTVGLANDESGVWKITQWLYAKIRGIFNAIFTVKRPRTEDNQIISSSLV